MPSKNNGNSNGSASSTGTTAAGTTGSSDPSTGAAVIDAIGRPGGIDRIVDTAAGHPFESRRRRRLVRMKARYVATFAFMGRVDHDRASGWPYAADSAMAYILGPADDANAKATGQGVPTETAKEDAKAKRAKVTAAQKQDIDQLSAGQIPLQSALKGTSLWDLRDPILNLGTAAVAPKGKATSKLTFRDDFLMHKGPLKATVTPIAVNVDSLLGAIETHGKTLRKALRDTVFLNNKKPGAPEEFAHFLDTLRSNLGAMPGVGARLRGGLYAIHVGIAQDTGATKALPGGVREYTIGEKDVEPGHLPALYVSKALEAFVAPAPSFRISDGPKLAEPKNWPTPEGYAKYVSLYFDQLELMLQGLRMRLERLPRLLDAMAYYVYHDVAERKDDMFGDLRHVINFFPAPYSNTPPSTFTDQHLEVDTAYLLEVLRTGSKLMPTRLISIDDYVRRFSVLDVRATREANGVFAVLAITPNVDHVGRVTAVYRERTGGATSAAASGLRGGAYRKFEFANYDTESKLEGMALGWAATVDSGLAIVDDFIAAKLPATDELFFAGGERDTFLYAAAVSNDVEFHIDYGETLGAIDGEVLEGPGGVGRVTGAVFIIDRRSDAPPMTAGAVASHAKEGDGMLETRNCATAIALSSKRVNGTDSWEARDAFVDRIVAAGTVRTPPLFRVAKSRSISAKGGLGYPLFKVQQTSDTGPVLVDSGAFKSIDLRLSHVMAAIAYPTVRVAVAESLDLAYEGGVGRMAYLIGRYRDYIAKQKAQGLDVPDLQRFPFDAAVKRLVWDAGVMSAIDEARSEAELDALPDALDKYWDYRYDLSLRANRTLQQQLIGGEGVDGRLLIGLALVHAIAQIPSIRDRVIADRLL